MAYLPCTPQLYCVFLYKRFSIPPIAKAEHPLRNSKQFLLLGSILVSGNLHLGPQFSSFFLFVNCLFFIFSEVESMNKNSSFLPSHLLIVRHCVYLHMHTPPPTGLSGLPLIPGLHKGFAFCPGFAHTSDVELCRAHFQYLPHTHLAPKPQPD